MELINGDSLAVLKDFAENSIDSIVTDPPAGIAFMGKEWDDHGTLDAFQEAMKEIFHQCERVLKPGGYALVWALPRTSHHTAMALEKSGFEIRDIIHHCFGSGFPKSLNISKAFDKKEGIAPLEIKPAGGVGFMKDDPNCQYNTTKNQIIMPEATSDLAKEWQGWGTALKPAVEHWILCRKPLSEKTVVDNVLKHGVGGINIDGCRVGNEKRLSPQKDTAAWSGNNWGGAKQEANGKFTEVEGRFPANLIHDGSEIVEKEFKESSRFFNNLTDNIDTTFIYQAKPSPAERNKGCEGLPLGEPSARTNPAPGRESALGKPRTNHHPTVKAIALMSHLIKLITPPKGICLDPFMGSGSTGVACVKLGIDFIGIERETEYFEIARARIGPISRVHI